MIEQSFQKPVKNVFNVLKNIFFKKKYMRYMTGQEDFFLKEYFRYF